MTAFSTAFRAAALTILLASGAFVTELTAQQKPAPAVEAGAPDRTVTTMDADEVRRAFMSVLERHPPSVARVMKLDPSLMRNESYLQAYPHIGQFLATHPDVPRNAPYYLEHVRGINDDWQQTPQQRMTEAILAGLAGFTAFIIVISTLVWLIRTVVEHRRWNRLSKIQAEVHTKLMDRFSSNEELLTYVQTPSGRRFLESGPSPLQEMTPTMSAPLSRILWSVQLGSVLLVSGLGMLFLSGRALSEAQEFFYIGGCLASAIGTGFVVSAAAAYLLSRRLGLLERPVHDNA
jgi:hypothetical protein